MNFIRGIIGFAKELIQKRFLIYELTKRDLKTRYTGSVLGIFWTFLQPIIMMFILYFVFDRGFKAGLTATKVPFISWLFCALVSWNYFSEALNSSTGVIDAYSFLVKKVNFRLAILPIVKILAGLVIHAIFIVILIIVLLVQGIPFSWTWLLIPYYCICIMVLCLGLAWITSSINVFVKDVAQIVQIIISFGFWLTPIFWNIDMMPENLRFFVKINPMFYVVEGYRKSFLYSTPLWKEDLYNTLYFWGFTFVILIIGMIIFKRLRPHFADVI
ncbi:MAG: ABC transporter permease [Spirochaetota bacterium]